MSDLLSKIDCPDDLKKLAADQQASLDALDTLFAALQHRAFGGELVRDEADEVAV